MTITCIVCQREGHKAFFQHEVCKPCVAAHKNGKDLRPDRLQSGRVEKCTSCGEYRAEEFVDITGVCNPCKYSEDDIA